MPTQDTTQDTAPVVTFRKVGELVGKNDVVYSALSGVFGQDNIFGGKPAEHAQIFLGWCVTNADLFETIKNVKGLIVEVGKAKKEYSFSYNTLFEICDALTTIESKAVLVKNIFNPPAVVVANRENKPVTAEDC